MKMVLYQKSEMEQEMDKGYNRADEMFKDIARR